MRIIINDQTGRVITSLRDGWFAPSVKGHFLLATQMKAWTPHVPVLWSRHWELRQHHDDTLANSTSPQPRKYDMKNWLSGKYIDAVKDWRQEEKWTAEDETARWHHWLSGHEFGWTLGVRDEQRGLACCSPWGHKELDTTERLNWTTI